MSSRNDLIRGALVADAAALGLHWIYDKDRVREIGGEEPEFVEPDVAHYKGVPGYFAHKGKRAGDPTHYGEQLRVALESLKAAGGAVDPQDYARRFWAHFGFGGSWVGYIDRATRETLRNIDDAARRALEATRSFDLGEFEGQRSHIESAVTANAAKWSGEKLDRALEKATRIRGEDDPQLIAATQRMGRAVAEARGGYPGSDDLQLPAVASVPVTVAFGAEVEPAVRVTNDSDEAVAWAVPVARMLEAAISGAGPLEAARAGRDAAQDAVRTRWEEALAFEGDAAAHFGRACPLPEAIPLVVALLREEAEYAPSLRRNILAGGDSAGRAVVLGAVLGAARGVPEDWAARTRALTEL